MIELLPMRAIDIHVHVPEPPGDPAAAERQRMAGYFRAEHIAQSPALHKGNVFIDLSGWSPKYFRPVLVQYATTILQDKVLFGSDYPAIQPERWLKDFELIEMKDEVRQKILLGNARKLLKI